jgi:hypothetical protein
VKNLLTGLLNKDRSAWLAPVAMLLALAIPNNFIILKFLTAILALGLFYSAVTSSKHFKSFVK